MPVIFLRIRGNHGNPIAVWRAPIVDPNRGGVGPILGIACTPPLEALDFALNLSNL